MPPIRVLNLSGSAYDMGYQHGMAYADEISRLSDERLRLSGEAEWVGRNFSREQIIELADACVDEHYRYAPESMEQLNGMAEATGLSIPELLVVNGFTDFVDYVYNTVPLTREPRQLPECTAMLVNNGATADGRGFLAQTWDMHTSATPYVILIHGRPKKEPEFYAFTITGCIGMIGMNEAGIAVGINNLLGADGQAGVMWPFVCRKVLRQDNLEDALDCILSAKLAGGHNYLLMDEYGRGYNIEAMSTSYHITELQDDPLTHANACIYPTTQAVERELTPHLIEDSEIRAKSAHSLLESEPVTPERLMAITRDRSEDENSICVYETPQEPWETCCAVVMRPASRELWGVWGLPNQNEYEYFRL